MRTLISKRSLFSDFQQSEEEPLTKDWMVVERRGGLRQTTLTSENTNEQNNKRTEIQMRLAGGIGISLINGVPEELVFATFNPIEVSVVPGCTGELGVRKTCSISLGVNSFRTNLFISQAISIRSNVFYKLTLSEV